MLHHVECNFRGTLPQVKAGPGKGQPHHVTWPQSALVVPLVSSWYLRDCNLQGDAEVVCSSLIWSSQVLPVRQLVSVIYAVKPPEQCDGSNKLRKLWAYKSKVLPTSVLMPQHLQQHLWLLRPVGCPEIFVMILRFSLFGGLMWLRCMVTNACGTDGLHEVSKQRSGEASQRSVTGYHVWPPAPVVLIQQ